ncbi:MAG: orotidine-5'-phosphate decarboxylase [Clostridiaceae bacterium]
MIIDKLYERVRNKGHVTLGLDTDISYIPEDFLNKYTSIEEALVAFNKRIIDATWDVVASYKIQIAYYEALGLQGLSAYKRTLDYIREKDVLIIGDIKRGDIAKTAEMYARAHFEGDFQCDFITLNPYMGIDTIEPFLPYVKNNNKGAFILIRTSNPGARDIQYVEGTDGRRVYETVGVKINKLNNSLKGSCGYGPIGGVVGCTHREEGERLRRELDKMFFLIPGYGAQGGKAEDVALYLKDGNGGIVNSSRKILLAYRDNPADGRAFEECAREEAIRMRDEILSRL